METKNSSNPNSLWIAIKNFDIDGGHAELSFAKRLARDNNWSQGFANRVIEEYRRFVFLAMTAGHPVSPSQIVDEAWHLHLLYTESYWNRLTKDILPRPLHHHPTKGGKQEDIKHANWYDQTLESYRKLFEQDPPNDIWPVNVLSKKPSTEDSWTISKRRFRRWAICGTALASILGLGVGCTPFLAQTSNSNSTIILVVTGIAVLVVGGIAAFFMLNNSDSTVDPSSPNDPHHEKRDSHTTGGTYSSCGGSGGSGTHSHSQDDGHGDGDSGGGDSGGGDSGGGDGGGGCGGGGCSS